MILKGDCIKVMKAIKPNSIDAIVTDPPYGLEFMGKKWDKLRNNWQAEKGRYHNDTTFLARGDRIRYRAGLEMQLWHEQWLSEAFKIMKPGASMLVMGGTRTFHRLACAIEDTGFIIKDALMWIYGSGFPKAQDLGKMIDKKMGVESEIICKHPNARKTSGTVNICKKDGDGYLRKSTSDLAKHWNGFKIGGIKPAYEPIIWAVKPPEGSYVDNVLKWGVGAVNVDECRIGVNPNIDDMHRTVNRKKRLSETWEKGSGFKKVMDEMSGNLRQGNPNQQVNASTIYGNKSKRNEKTVFANFSGGASRFFYCAKASRSERNEGLGNIEKKPYHWSSGTKNPGSFQSDKTEREVQNNHPTVKPISLMSWLIKLVTRENQIVLDPFLGSGTIGISAVESNRKFIGIEREDEYLEIAQKRIKHCEAQPIQRRLNG